MTNTSTPVAAGISPRTTPLLPIQNVDRAEPERYTRIAEVSADFVDSPSGDATRVRDQSSWTPKPLPGATGGVSRRKWGFRVSRDAPRRGLGGPGCCLQGIRLANLISGLLKIEGLISEIAERED